MYTYLLITHFFLQFQSYGCLIIHTHNNNLFECELEQYTFLAQFGRRHKDLFNPENSCHQWAYLPTFSRTWGVMTRQSRLLWWVIWSDNSFSHNLYYSKNSEERVTCISVLNYSNLLGKSIFQDKYLLLLYTVCLIRQLSWLIKYKYKSQLIILSKLSDRGSLGCEKRCLRVPRRVMAASGCDPRVGGELATMPWETWIFWVKQIFRLPTNWLDN